MLNPASCPASTSSQWTSFTGLASHVLSQPLLVISVLVGLFGLISLAPRYRGRRPLRALVATAILSYLLILFPPTVNVAEKVLARPLPHDSGMTADAVVILGRGAELNPSRVAVAAKLWEEDRAPLIFASGIVDAPKIVNMLHSKGIPAQALDGEGCSRTTYENAKFTAALLEPRDVKRILLVTDTPHMLRSLLTFRNFGFSVIPVSSPTFDLSRRNRTRLVMREYVGLIGYGLLGRYFTPDDSARGLLSHLDEPSPQEAIVFNNS
ncbi:MAG: YdcF family protein [Cyanobacteria bacterium CRU_2_1]|nr:YdcF family protein [Cyanobacteria bacterium RU_5_0]NJR61397.1 YdcF family protein [Cyanobacteria bacterium CRU_2_1]